MDNPYQFIPAEIEKIDVETPNIKTLFLKPAQPVPFQTGQFIELAVPGLGEGPFTPSSDPYVEDKMEVTIMRAGRVTDVIHQMKPGDTVAVRGPYGLGYPLDDFKDRDVVIIGGGVGLAPLRSLFLALLHNVKKYKSLTVLNGARTPDDLVYRPLYPEWEKLKSVDFLVTVDVGDDQWKGNTGVVTTLLDKTNVNCKKAVAVVCGPPIMMKFATLKCLEMGFKESAIYLSMEKNMSCGFGKCGHCRLGQFYVCKDGPVFTYDRIKHIPDIFD